jgi:hypothetical protein
LTTNLLRQKGPPQLPTTNKMSIIHDKQMPEPPSEFFCPITCEIMREPLMCRSGLSFERSAILSWIQGHDGKCPMTRRSLSVCDLVPNRALQYRIRAWCLANAATELLDSPPSVVDDPFSKVIFTCAISFKQLDAGVPIEEEEEFRPVQEEKMKRYALTAIRTNIWRLRHRKAYSKK